MKAYTVKPETVRRDWPVVNAAGRTLGRLTTEIARRLRGRYKPEYTPYVDTGDYTVVISVEQVYVTGAKATDKTYYRHSDFLDGIKLINSEKLIVKAPERVIEAAIRGMLPRNPLGRDMYRKLKVHKGASHPHTTQQSQELKI